MREKRFKTKQKRAPLAIMIIIIFQVFTASFISCLLIFYGLFPVTRKMIVGTAMSSYKHQYIAKLFFNDSQIFKILNNGVASKENLTQKISTIKINSYEGNNIERYDINSSRFKGYMVVIKNPLKVKVGYTKNLEKQGEKTSDIAKDHNAIVAINGGGFMDKSNNGTLWAGTGAYPTGFVFSCGKIVYQDVSDTKVLDVVALDLQGKLIIGSHSINDLKKLKVSEAVAFGPALIINGETTFNGDGGQGITSRTAIGQRKDGAILLLVVDGRRINMPGATLHDIQKIMLDYNAYNATNLDGGSSSTLYYKGNIINNPCNPLGERTIATALYVEP